MASITITTTAPQDARIVQCDTFGGIRTEVGPAGYVLQTGERYPI